MKVLKALPYILIGFLVIFILLMLTEVFFNNADEGINLTGEQKPFPYSKYSISNGEIYFNNPA